MPAKIDLTGKTFNRLKVKKEAGRDRWGQILWECECSCGSRKKVIATGGDLRRGNTKSCGCLDSEKAASNIRKQTVGHSNPNAIKTKKISAKNTSGIRGVCPTKSGRWRAYIGHKGECIYLGEFLDKKDAEKARKEAEKKYYEPLLKKLEVEKGDRHMRIENITENHKKQQDIRTRFTPVVGESYKNRCGSTFICRSEAEGDFAAVMENPVSHWILVAHGCGIYEDGRIDWDYSTNGHFGY